MFVLLNFGCFIFLFVCCCCCFVLRFVFDEERKGDERCNAVIVLSSLWCDLIWPLEVALGLFVLGRVYFGGRKSYLSIMSEKNLWWRRKRIVAMSNVWTSHWQKKKVIFFPPLPTWCEDNTLLPPSPQIRKLFHNYSGSRTRIRYFSAQCKW